MFNSISGSSTNKGIGGLASGMDTDSLVEGLTYNTTNKIEKKMQEKQLVDWKKSAYRTMAGGLTEFNNKYFSYGSSSNILSTNFFQSYSVNNLSEHVKLSGKIENAKNVVINDIKQLATKTKYTANQFNASGNLKGEFSEEKNTSDLAGKSLTLTVSGKEYTLNISNEFGKNINDSSSVEQKNSAIQKELQRLVNGHKDLNGKIQVEIGSDNALSISSISGLQTIAFSGSEADMKILGFDKTNNGIGSISGAAIAHHEVFETRSLSEQVDGKSLTLNFNGLAKTITFDKEKIDDYSGSDTEKVTKYLNAQLEKAFGANAVTASTTNPAGNLTFNVADSSSIFSITGGSAGLLGKGNVFDLAVGSSNKINNNMTLDQLGLAGLTTDKYQSMSFSDKDLLEGDKLTKDLTIKMSDGSVLTMRAGDTLDALDAKLRENKMGVRIDEDPITGNLTFNFSSMDPNKTFIKDGTEVGDVSIEDPDSGYDGKVSNGLYTLTINEVDIQISGNKSIGNMLTLINQSNAGVNASFSSLTNTFVFEATDSGSNGRIEFGHEGTPNSSLDGSLAKLLFGVDTIGEPATTAKGQDSIVDLTINGVSQTVKRATNLIEVDGMTIELVSKAADITKPDGTVETVKENIRFDVSNDVDKVVKNIKDFVESYNALIGSITAMVDERPDKDRKYPPLTDAQKKDMTEDQIKNWEIEAKKGILFNDSTLKKIQQDMRSALYAPVAGLEMMMTDIGIKTGDWQQKGKLEIDETKLKKALLEKPDQVAALFTQKSSVDYAADLKGDKKTQRYQESGLMERMADTLKYAVATTTPKGVLLNIAGMPNDRTDGENTLQKKTDTLNSEIKELQRRLKAEQTRYYNQFTAMEKFINQMNQQSAWLSQQLGG